jgi:ribose/xylose/arabinose/galactoside ABC-type transport system permease subunit
MAVDTGDYRVNAEVDSRIISLWGSTIFNSGLFWPVMNWFGRYVIAMGSNSEAARLAGLNVGKMTVAIYAICGFFCALAGIILCARNNSAQPAAAATYAFDSITAIVLGGVSISGGRGKITGAIAGVVFIGILNNALILMGINEYYKEVFKGAILIVAVALDAIELKNKKAVLTSVSAKR